MMGKLYDRPGRLPTARHGGQVDSAMAEEATTVVIFVASRFVLPRLLQIPKRRFREQILKHWASLGVIGAHKSTRSFQRFWLEMDHKTRTQKHERNTNSTTPPPAASSLTVHPFFPSPLKYSPFYTVSASGPLRHHEYEWLQETSTGT